MIYLDHAATTPVPRAVADAMYEVLTEHYGNPSSQYQMGLDMKKKVEGWRKTVADAMGCDPKNLYFTACGTESNNIAPIPVSYPGTALREGSTGNSVRVIQAQLNRIANDYPSIGKVNVDGVFGATTRAESPCRPAILRPEAPAPVGRFRTGIRRKYRSARAPDTAAGDIFR